MRVWVCEEVLVRRGKSMRYLIQDCFLWVGGVCVIAKEALPVLSEKSFSVLREEHRKWIHPPHE